MFCARAVSGKRLRRNMEAEALCTFASSNGSGQGSGNASGKLGWPNMMNWQALPGVGSRRTAPRGKRRWAGKPRGPIPRIGGKKGVKRHVLTDGRGVPLSLVVTGANVHDQKGLEPLLRRMVIRRPKPVPGRPQTLCLDKGYDSSRCRKLLLRRGYRDGIKCRGAEKAEKQRDPRKRARRWVVERTHSWITRASHKMTTLLRLAPTQASAQRTEFRCVNWPAW